MVGKKEIIYPIFIECTEYTSDTCWRKIFENLAYGKTPQGCYISKNHICSSQKDKEFRYKICKTLSSKKIFDDLYSLFHTKLGILSMKQKNNKKKEFNQINLEIQNKKDWRDIKKKNIKDTLIELFCINMMKKYCLSYKKTRSLISLIFIAIMFKVISSKDIHYSQNQITKIDGIVFEKNNFHFTQNIYENDIENSPEIIFQQNLMSKNWEKFIETINK